MQWNLFLIIFIIISLHAYSLIYRFKLVDLFHAERSGETEPKASLILALVSIAAIVTGYVLAFHLAGNFFLLAPTVLALIIIGSYGLFHSFMVFVIRLSRKNTSSYYRGMNLISISNLLYRIKSNATLLATIAILSATTLTAMGMSYGIYHEINKSVDLHNPFSFVYWNNAGRDQKVNQALAQYPQNQLLHAVEIGFISTRGTLPDMNILVALIPESKYNEIAQIKGWDEVNINKAEDAVIVHSDYDFNGKFVGEKIAVELENKSKIKFHITARRNCILTNNDNTRNTLVLRDEVYEHLARAQKPYSLRALIVNNQKRCPELNAELVKILPKYSWNSYYSEYMLYMEESGMLMFVGGFLGLVILLATGSIIYFRQLNDAQKEKLNYQILRNIGVSRSEIKASIRKQLLYVFLFPLLLGIAHSWAALMALSHLLLTSLVTSTIITIAVYTLVYLFYYLLTVRSYNEIVNPEN